MWRRHLRMLESHKTLRNDGAVQPASAASGAEPPRHELDLHHDFESSSPWRRRQAVDRAFSRTKQTDSHDA